MSLTWKRRCSRFLSAPCQVILQFWLFICEYWMINTNVPGLSSQSTRASSSTTTWHPKLTQFASQPSNAGSDQPPPQRRVMQLHCCSCHFVPVNLLSHLWKAALNSQEAFTHASMRWVAEQSAQLLNQGCHLTHDGKGHCYEILHDGSGAAQQSSWNKRVWRINQLVLRHVDGKRLDLRLLMSDTVFACTGTIHMESILPSVSNSQRQPRPGCLRLSSLPSPLLLWINELPYTLTD